MVAGKSREKRSNLSSHVQISFFSAKSEGQELIRFRVGHETTNTYLT